MVRYMQGFKCKVTGATSNIPLAKPKAPVYCPDDASKCVKGAKQMIAWHQLDGNNIETPNQWGVTPGYNEKCGWSEGPQRDIFETKTVQPTTLVTSKIAAPTETC